MARGWKRVLGDDASPLTGPTHYLTVVCFTVNIVGSRYWSFSLEASSLRFSGVIIFACKPVWGQRKNSRNFEHFSAIMWISGAKWEGDLLTHCKFDLLRNSRGYFLAGWVRRGSPARVAQGGLVGILGLVTCLCICRVRLRNRTFYSVLWSSGWNKTQGQGGRGAGKHTGDSLSFTETIVRWQKDFTKKFPRSKYIEELHKHQKREKKEERNFTRSRRRPRRMLRRRHRLMWKIENAVSRVSATFEEHKQRLFEHNQLAYILLPLMMPLVRAAMSANTTISTSIAAALGTSEVPT
ncbi:hypothetical protein M9H77_04449 [Catharanthus roseus]|uniref:Uncharacterized protein n=1 Tax=Catharanthus roseus TaxID=4058 RepID=A0ACC0CE79_CATRO|nr:hypothetical protein M9H77_04449 [Catharanthus roseus]